jgi:hypothetical protein
MMRDPRILEHEAMRLSFAALERRWCLTPDERTALLGPAADEVDHERCMRVVLQFDSIMSQVIGPDTFSWWLRSPGPKATSPLEFLSIGATERSAMLAAARMRYREVTGLEV